jgi:hypothetical protein
MDEIGWPILGVHHVAVRDFVRFWERLYSTYDEDFYQENIGKSLTKERIERWFEWKNGGPLSAKKAKSILRYHSPKERIDHTASAEALQEFLNRPGGAIYRIFWLHLQHPCYFPIYDQHVHRAMAFMLKWIDLEIPENERARSAPTLPTIVGFLLASRTVTIGRWTGRS